jgi:hypothetical protein
MRTREVNMERPRGGWRVKVATRATTRCWIGEVGSVSTKAEKEKKQGSVPGVF